MIVNNIHVQGILLATPAFAVFLLFCWRVVAKEWSDWKDIRGVLVLLIFPVSCLGIGYLLERSVVWTVVYACCGVVLGGLMLWYSISPDFGNKVTGTIMLICLRACLIFFIVSVPVAIIPTFRTSPAQPDHVQFDPAVLASSTKEIADKFASFEQVLLEEQKKMSQSFENLFIEVKNQNAKVEGLQRTKSELEGQVAKYQEVLSLSKPQILSVQSLLKKDRYIDYIIGFILGIISSGIVAFSGFALRQIKKNDTEAEKAK
jgi:hypothetical protein